MNKENCTKGPIDSRYRFNDRSDKAIEVTNQERTPVATVHRGFIPQQEQEANAELIAEAFNTLHTSGFTPAELYDQLQCALEKLRAIDPTPPTLSGSSI